LIKGEKRFYEAKKLLREEGEAGVRLVVDTFTSDEIDYILMRLKNEASDWLAKYDGAMRWREIYNHESWKMGELLNEQSEGNKTL
jgi:hypothetical protein